MDRALLMFVIICAVGCAAPLHLRPVGLQRDGGSMQSVFVGGWDGHRLPLMDDNAIEPGVTHGDDVARELGHLNADDYAVIFVESSQLTNDVATAHSIFCNSPVCLVVLDRKGGTDLASYGSAIAIFELGAAPDMIVKQVWMDARVVRPPGPTAWPKWCLNAKDKPHYLHPDGAGFYPAHPSPSGEGYALFGPREIPEKYRSEGFEAPGDGTSCVDQSTQPGPPKPAGQ